MSDAIKVLKFWVKIFPDVEDKEVCKEAILALENQKDCFVCDICGRETASCLTLCPDCNERKQGALDRQDFIIKIIKKQKKIYESNVDITNNDNWQRGAFDACEYLIQLIKEGVEK